MTCGPEQRHIWSHFQDPAFAGVFEAARPRHAYILRKIRRLAGLLTPMVLNVGIGDGNFERRAQGLGWSIFSLDPDLAAVERLAAAGITARQGVVEAIPFPENQFDFVVASEVLEHLSGQQRLLGLQEIRRTLKRGGYFIGTVPYQENLEDNVAVCPKCRHVFHRWGHTTSFDREKIRAELAPHFGRVSSRTTAFVEFKGRSMGGKLKGLARLVLGRCGAAIAVPTIAFVGVKQ
jgi:SAM-dependent methyltransferase